MEIRHVLCPVDFSDGSRRAFDQAVAIARWCGASVTILHVFTPTAVAATPSGEPGYQPAGALHADRERLTAEIRAFIEGAHVPGIMLDVVIREGHPATEIVAHATTMRTGLLVLGTHGRSGVTRLLLGSVAEEVLRSASCPVLTVPPHHPDAVPATAGLYASILCPVDFSDVSATAVRFAVRLAADAGGQVTLVHVLGHDLRSTPDLYDTMISDSNLSDEAYRQRREALVRARLRELVPETAVDACHLELAGPGGSPASEILGIAKARRSDVIVLGIEPRSGSDTLVSGSTTHDVLRGATCAVLTILGPEPAH